MFDSPVDPNYRTGKELYETAFSLFETDPKKLTPWFYGLSDLERARLLVYFQDELVSVKRKYEALITAIGSAVKSFTEFNSKLDDIQNSPGE